MHDSRHPKEGDVVRDRTVICVKETLIVFGLRQGDTPNCGAYVTDFEEWFAYKFQKDATNGR